MLMAKAAYRCDLHGINTCPLTPSALTYTDAPCCDRAELLELADSESLLSTYVR